MSFLTDRFEELKNSIIERKTIQTEDGGKCFYRKFKDGVETWKYYNKYNKEICYRTSKGYERIKTYNDKRRIINIKDNSGYWAEYKYDKNNRILYEEYSDGLKYIYDYTEDEKYGTKILIKEGKECE